MATEIDTCLEALFHPLPPSAHDQELARASVELLSSVLKPGEEDVEFSLDGEVIILPVSVIKMLLSMLSQMSRGNAVSIVPSHAELTTQQAADVLKVSRPFLVKLLEGGSLPYRKVGSHRRVRFDDLMQYQERSQQERLRALAKLQEDAQENDMGY
jgi:excisionase family DNA binding protein